MASLARSRVIFGYARIRSDTHGGGGPVGCQALDGCLFEELVRGSEPDHQASQSGHLATARGLTVIQSQHRRDGEDESAALQCEQGAEVHAIVALEDPLQPGAD